MRRFTSRRGRGRRRFGRRFRRSIRRAAGGRGRSQRRSRVVKIPRSRGVLPLGTICRLKYADTINLSATSGLLTTHIFRLNGLYDPDFTGVGHQPMGFDQMVPLYYKYLVYRVSWRVSFQAPTGENAAHIVVVPRNATGTGSITEMMEAPYAVTRLMSNAAGGGVTTIKGGIHLAKLNGVTKKLYYAEDQYQGTGQGAPGDPVEANRLVIALHQINGVTTGLNVLVQLFYDCYWFEPVPLGGS